MIYRRGFMELKQYLYTLKLVPKLIDENNWTDRENKIVEDHFEKLNELLKEDKLILAGKTSNMDENTFGIVIIQVETDEEANTIMVNDPAVKEGVMMAELFPYRVALFNKNFNVC
jgi:uncharacterized protein